MDDQIKIKIAMASIDILFNQGLPALIKILTILNNKEKITTEDIQKLIKDPDSASYFK